MPPLNVRTVSVAPLPVTVVTDGEPRKVAACRELPEVSIQLRRVESNF